MNPQDSILIARLLREREAAFVTVWECEDRIRRILQGANLPLPAAPDLPSRRRRSVAPRRPPALAAGTVRRRHGGEDAYRLTCVCRGQPCVSLTDDADSVRALLALPPTALAVLRIETVSLDEEGAATVIECLWNAPDAPRPPDAEAAPGTGQADKL